MAKINIIKLGAIAGALTAIIGLGAVVDSRYQTAQAAGSESEQRELGDINTKIEVLMLELNYLGSKKDRDSDDENREIMLRAQLAVLLSRQLELNK